MVNEGIINFIYYLEKFLDGENMKGILDDIDKEILKVLQKNSRTPLREISKRVGLAESTVYERIKKLKGKGIIKRFTIIPDPESLGNLPQRSATVFLEHF